MNLFKKIDWYYKLAQEMASSTAPMELKEVHDVGVTGKAMPKSGWPSESIRELASRLLRRLTVHPSVPRDVKGGTSSFGDLLSDFNNQRFTDKDLNYHWGDYIVALMNKANALVKVAATKQLSDFYATFVEDLGDLYDQIADTNGWETKATKPAVAEWAGAVENPFGADKTSPSAPKTTLTPVPQVKDRVEQNTVPSDIPMSGPMKLKLPETGPTAPPSPKLTSRKDRMKKLASILKK